LWSTADFTDYFYTVMWKSARSAIGPQPPQTTGVHGLPLAPFIAIMNDQGRLRILTVEDEPALTHLLALLLGGPAAKVTSASDGWIALMKIGAAAHPFDVVITDHNMQRVNGLELVRRLRARDYSAKIIVLSAHLTKENIRAYEALNVDMMLAKPFDVEELQLALSLLTKKPAATPIAPMAVPAPAAVMGGR
jgi:CheY-like chemotaxis protein